MKEEWRTEEVEEEVCRGKRREAREKVVSVRISWV
jgi:hypothetical protein